MKKGIITIALGLMLAIAIFVSLIFLNDKSGHINSCLYEDKNSSTINQGLIPEGPRTIIYKTRSDYYNLVPVTLSDDKKEIISYPDVRDVYYNEKLAYPTKLDKGYLLDNRGLTKNSAFLNITYEEYSKLPKTPSKKELFKKIIDKNPFIEIYDCGNEYQFSENNEIGEINAIINSGQLSKCKSLMN